MKEYLDLFNLDENFNLDDLKKAYKKKILEYNPNLAKDDLEKEEFKKITKKLNFANKILKQYIQNNNSEDITQKDNVIKESNLIHKQTLIQKTSNNKTKITTIGLIGLLILFIYNFINTPEETVVPAAKEEIKETPKEPQKLTTQEMQILEIYMNILQSRIKSNWQLPRNMTTNANIKVVFTISKDGRLIGKPIITESSGNKEADELCILAVISTMPYKPLPPVIERDSIDIELTFEAIKK